MYLRLKSQVPDGGMQLISNILHGRSKWKIFALFVVLCCVCSGSDAFTSMDIVKTCCQNFSEALQLATDQRYAHEYGDTAVAQELQTRGEHELGPAVVKLIGCQEVLAGRGAPRTRSRNDVRGGSRASELEAAIGEQEKESRSQGAPGGTDFGDALFSAKKRRSSSSALRRPPVIDHEDLQR